MDATKWLTIVGARPVGSHPETVAEVTVPVAATTSLKYYPFSAREPGILRVSIEGQAYRSFEVHGKADKETVRQGVAEAYKRGCSSHRPIDPGTSLYASFFSKRLWVLMNWLGLVCNLYLIATSTLSGIEQLFWACVFVFWMHGLAYPPRVDDWALAATWSETND
jgi:hypothetical protein